MSDPPKDTRSLQRWPAHYATPRTIAVALLATIIWMIVLLNYSPAADLIEISNELGTLPLDQRLTSTPAESYAYLADIGERGRRLYVPGLWIDMVTPVFGAIFLMLSLSYLNQRLWRWTYRIGGIVFLPLLSIVGEWGENVSILWMLTLYPERLPIVATVAIYFTQLKYIFSFLPLLIVVGEAIMVVVVKFYSQIPPSEPTSLKHKKRNSYNE